MDVRTMTAEEVFNRYAKSEGEVAFAIINLDSEYEEKIAKAPSKSTRMRLGKTTVWIQSKWQLENERDRAKGLLFEQLITMGVDATILNQQYPTAEDCRAMVREG